MNAADLIFPQPMRARLMSGGVKLPKTLAVRGEAIPAWLRQRLARACTAAGVRLAARGETAVDARVCKEEFRWVPEAALRTAAYRLDLRPDGAVTLAAGGLAGLRHGVITLSLLLEAWAAGARLTSLSILDAPAFEVRGAQVDMAREFYPPVPYLKMVVDRLVDLKLNTLWLYIENHFHAPGMEDISPRGGLTPEQAREISAYAAERGVDVVPGTNLLSHMEGWFRLERYAGLCDGRSRSYPVLTRREALDLTGRYVAELAKAFLSPNLHAGLDELLFTGANPEAAEAVSRMGKAAYFGEFVRELVRRIQGLGKTVWWWDDMPLGKNVFRPEGFNEDASKALAYIPADTVLVHWWYWADEGGKHRPVIERVAASGRRFVVAPSISTFRYDYGSLATAARNQEYLARVGRKHGAFGYVCTHWESRYGNSFESTWPLLAMSAGQAWTGGRSVGPDFLRALGFVVAGDTGGALGRFLQAADAVENLLLERGKRRHPFRGELFLEGPHMLWRRFSALLDGKDRAEMAARLREAERCLAQVGDRDPGLKDALRLPLALWGEGLALIHALDDAWAEYHAAALAERDLRRGVAFACHLHNACGRIRQAANAVGRYRRVILRHERAFGHTAYDAWVLARHEQNLRGVCDLARACAGDDGGLPYFEKLLQLPDAYHNSNLRQIQVQNTFHQRCADLPWLPRRGRLAPRRL